MITQAFKFVLDVWLGTLVDFIKVLWAFFAVMGGTASIVIGIDGLWSGYWLSALAVLLGALFFATLIPRFAQKLGPLEKGLVLFVVVKISSDVLAEMDATTQTVLMNWMVVIAMGALTNQLIKQLRGLED